MLSSNEHEQSLITSGPGLLVTRLKSLILISVVCTGRPPVQDASYAPHLSRYRYGDVLRINRCGGNLEPVGPPDHRIECQADGSWSASFYCRKCKLCVLQILHYENFSVVTWLFP